MSEDILINHILEVYAPAEGVIANEPTGASRP